MEQGGLSYCVELARRHDPDRFLLALMMSPGRREALCALLAFNYEIARTRELVTDAPLGLIRLQWWRDAIDALYGGGTVPQNEILPVLAQAICDHDLPREAFDALIDARTFDLEGIPPDSLDALARYAEATNAPLGRLALGILGQADDAAAIEKTGAAFGLAGILRAVPFHARQGRCLMPADLMVAHGMTGNMLCARRPEDSFRAVTGAVADRAFALLAEAKPRSKYLALAGTQALLYLKRIRGLRYDVFDPGMAVPPPFFHLRLLFSAVLLK